MDSVSGFLYLEKSKYRCSKDECSFQAKMCPRCNDGYLVARKDEQGRSFLGCSNFQISRCRYTEEEFQRGRHYRDYVS